MLKQNDYGYAYQADFGFWFKQYSTGLEIAYDCRPHGQGFLYGDAAREFRQLMDIAWEEMDG